MLLKNLNSYKNRPLNRSLKERFQNKIWKDIYFNDCYFGGDNKVVFLGYTTANAKWTHHQTRW